MTETAPEKHSTHLPQAGTALVWLVVFVAVYFAGAALYVMGYTLVVEALRSEAAANVDLQTQIREHIGSVAGQVGVYSMQFALLLPMIISASDFHSQSWRETLAVRPFRGTDLIFWLAIFAGYLIFEVAGNYFVPVEPGPFLDTIRNSKSFSLTFTMVVLAPILEEFLFRGYLFQAWRHSALGLWGTLVVTSLLFSVVHFAQYHWILGIYLFVLAMILGLAREKTGSIWVPVIIHGVNNLIAAIFVVFLGLA